mmetsp:Transcript_29692/g.85409  ORF Transcript_29692/g.85409 Transcript_29692/m.85409 type:complete len:247 (+) Transcript_29692:211-951(+)
MLLQGHDGREEHGHHRWPGSEDAVGGRSFRSHPLPGRQGHRHRRLQQGHHRLAVRDRGPHSHEARRAPRVPEGRGGHCRRDPVSRCGDPVIAGGEDGDLHVASRGAGPRRGQRAARGFLGGHPRLHGFLLRQGRAHRRGLGLPRERERRPPWLVCARPPRDQLARGPRGGDGGLRGAGQDVRVQLRRHRHHPRGLAHQVPQQADGDGQPGDAGPPRVRPARADEGGQHHGSRDGEGDRHPGEGRSC